MGLVAQMGRPTGLCLGLCLTKRTQARRGADACSGPHSSSVDEPARVSARLHPNPLPMGWWARPLLKARGTEKWRDPQQLPSVQV